MKAAPLVNGEVSRGFEAVRDAFIANFTRRQELGGACSAWVHGEQVVDLWGGLRNGETGAPWRQDTMVIVYSASKGLAAMTLALAHSRGWLDYEERVSRYWPEFAQHGKDRVTVRQLLAHQAGLFVLDEPLDRGLVADLDRLAVVLARQKPAWAPGARQAYHAITLGFYENELLRRIDPRHRSLGQFFQDEIASPLGLDVYIRLPESIPGSRLATMTRPTLVDLFRGFPLRLALDTLNRRSNIVRALRGSELPLDAEHVYARDLEVPSGGAVGTARAIARAYSVFASGGRALGAPARDARPAGGAGGSALARLLRRVHEGPRDPVRARLHEVHARAAIRHSGVVRRTGRRRRARLCRSRGGCRLRLRDEPHGDAPDGRSAGRGAAGRAVWGDEPSEPPSVPTEISRPRREAGSAGSLTLPVVDGITAFARGERAAG